jgi:hypothetical protein
MGSTMTMMTVGEDNGDENVPVITAKFVNEPLYDTHVTTVSRPAEFSDQSLIWSKGLEMEKEERLAGDPGPPQLYIPPNNLSSRTGLNLAHTGVIVFGV